MVPLAALWLPILLSSVVVFVVSAIVCMFLPYHRTDWLRLPDEAGTMDHLRQGNLTPGMYAIPYALDDPNSEETKAKFAAGPVGYLYVKPTEGALNMGPNLIKVFIYYLVLNFFLAYLGHATLPVGTDYLKVFQVMGAAGFMAHSMANVHYAIWFGATWSFCWKNMFDGLLYGLLTAGIFASMWPG